MAQQVAWLGLGNMGRGMVKNLVEKGNLQKPLLIWNRTQKRADDLAAQLTPGKVKVVSSIEDAVASSDIVFTCVGRDQDIKDTLNTALQSDVKGKLFADCSTVHPDTSNELYTTVTSKGAHFIAAPVFGAPAMADSGMLVFVLAGLKADVDKVKPYTKGVMGRDFLDFSDQEVGKASLMKIIGNTFVVSMVETLSAGHTLAEKSGLGTENIHKFCEAMFPGPFVAYSKRMISGDYYDREEPLFNVDLALKDVNHALALAESSGTKLKAAEVHKAHLEDVKKLTDERGLPADLAGIYGAVRHESGLTFKNKE